MAAGTLVVKISANITDFSRNLDAAEKRLMKAGDRLEKLGGDLSLKVTAPLVALSAAFAKSAAEDAASVEKMGRAFGTATGQMDSFIKSLMKSVPATDDQLRTLATSTDTLLTSMGLAPQKAAAMSQTVLKLAGDLAAYNHVSLETATDAVDKAMAGRTRGLTELNVVVTEADVKAKAYQLGLAKVGSELTSTAKAQATLAAILDRSAKQQGEAARTYGDNENALARLKQAADGVADSFGAVVLPTFVKVTDAAGGMLNALAQLPDTTKSVIVGVGATVAALGPLIYVGGTIVKTFTLARAALMGLVATQALSGMGALIASVTSLSEAMTVASIAAGALVTALAPLLVVTGVVAAIAAIGYAIYKSGESAREAKAKLDAYKVTLAGFTTAAQSQASAKSIVGQIRTLQATPLATNGDPLHDAHEQYLRDQQVQALQQQLIAANNRTRALSAITGTVGTGGGGTGSGTGGSVTDPVADLTRKATTLARTYELTNAQGKPLAGLNAEITRTMQDLTAALGAQTNQWSELALKIRQAHQELSKAAAAGNATLITQSTATGAPGLNLGATNITTGSLPTLKEPPSLTKQVTLQERMVAQLATLPQQFASTLGQYLGPVLARMGGGVGGAIGASFGGGIGGAIGNAVAGSIIGPNTGKIAGAVLGSVIPGVGTIVGSLAGSFIGGTLGKLFGGGGQSAADKAAEKLNALAAAAQKVQEAISGLPEGIKIASYRFDATAPAPVDTKPNGGTGKTGSGSTGGDQTGDAKTGGAASGSGTTGGAKGGNKDGGSSKSFTFTGDIHLNGVTDLPSFFRQLSAYAETQTGRGGVSGLQLATS